MILIVAAIATLLGGLTSVIGQQEPPRNAATATGARQDDSPEAVHKRISGKVERIKAGLQECVASGRDPSAILRTMKEKVGPLLDAGKLIEAEPELDRVLER